MKGKIGSFELQQLCIPSFCPLFFADLSCRLTRNSKVPTCRPQALRLPLSPLPDILVRQGHGQAECLTCQRTYSSRNLTFSDEVGRRTSNYNHITCPLGHPLLKCLRIRFMSRG